MDVDSNDWSHVDIDSPDREKGLKNIAHAAKIVIGLNDAGNYNSAVVDLLVNQTERDMLINDLNTYLTDRGKSLGDLFPHRELGTGPVPSLDKLTNAELSEILTRIYDDDEDVQKAEAADLKATQDDMALGNAVAKGLPTVDSSRSMMDPMKRYSAISQALGNPSAMGNLATGNVISRTKAVIDNANAAALRRNAEEKQGQYKILSSLGRAPTTSNNSSILSTKRSLDYANINGVQGADNKRERTGSESDSEEDMDGGKNKKRKTRKNNKQIKRKTKKNKKQRKTKKDVKRIKRRQTKRR
jgi:hypothetical protein